MPSKPQSRKSKGRKLQQHVRDFLTELFSWGEGDAESCSMGAGGIDVKLSPKARSDFPFSMECKNTKKFPSVSALRQSSYNKYTGTLEGVVWKPHGKKYSESIIYFNFEEFSDFWKTKTSEKSVPVEVK